MKVSITGLGRSLLSNKIALALLVRHIAADRPVEGMNESVEINALPLIDDYDCREAVAYPNDNGRSSWSATRKLHNYRK